MKYYRIGPRGRLINAAMATGLITLLVGGGLDIILEPCGSYRPSAHAQGVSITPPAKKVSTHPPFSLGHCNECHQGKPGSVTLSSPPGKDPNTGKALLARPIQDLCRPCHVRPPLEREWLHAPIAQGGWGCVMCHSPHESNFPHLLITAPENLCLRCHNKKDIVRSEAHRTASSTLCLECHNPHSGINRFLLKKDHKDVWLPPPASAKD